MYSLITPSLFSTKKTPSFISGLQRVDDNDELPYTETYSKMHNKNKKLAKEVVSRIGEDMYNSNGHILQVQHHKFPLSAVLPTLGKDFWGKG